MEFINSLVNTLNACFNPISELDLLFRLDFVHTAVDYMIASDGAVVTTNAADVVPVVRLLKSLEG